MIEDVKEFIENPFIEKANSEEFTARLTESQCKILISIVSAKSLEEELKNLFIPQIILKRIDAFKLGISFTPKALGIIDVFAMNNPGRAVIILIDCLTKFGEVEVNDSMLCKDLYPYGFYNMDTFVDYVENYLKSKKVRWSTLY